MISKEVFEEFGKNRLKELLKKGEKPIIIAGFIDFFGDAAISSCTICGVPVWIQPWILEAVVEHGLKVVCFCCTPTKDLEGQIMVDFAKIEDQIGQRRLDDA